MKLRYRRVPNRFRAVMRDQTEFFNLRTCNERICCIISFDGVIDEKRMERAVKLSIYAELILYCRFIEDLRGPYWERGEIEEENVFSLMENKGSTQDEMNRFLTKNMSVHESPQIQVRLFRAQKKIYSLHQYEPLCL